jgi:hypothetical protein
MTKRMFIGILVALASAGWLVPLALGVSTYLDFWQLEGWPRIVGQHPMNSFPFIAFAQQCFNIAFLWLGVVIIGWSYAGFICLNRSRPA